MKKKKISILITICLLLVVGMRKANAAQANLYNGNGESEPLPPSAKKDCTASFCSWREGYQLGLKIGLYYINDAKFYTVNQINDGPIVQPVYISYSEFANKLGLTNIKLNTDTTWNDISNGVAQAFGAPTNNYTSINDKDKFESTFKKVFGIDFNNIDFDKDSQPSSETNTATYGYRIIIEPVLQFKRSDQLVRYTFKEVSYRLSLGEKYGVTTTNSYSQFSKYLTVKIKDVGIDAQTGTSCANAANDAQNLDKGIYSSLMKNENGCGYNIIDITQVIDTPKCYSRTIDDSSGGMTCKNIDKNNETEFREEYKETDCDKLTKEEETNTVNGKLIDSKGNCNLYCIESAYASFPGGISTESELGRQIFQGSYFAWPKVHTSSNMNMYMTSSLECSFISKSGKTCTDSEIENLRKSVISKINGNDFKFNANLTAGTNREINEALKQVNAKTTATSNKNSKGEQKYTVSKTVYFEINDNVNRIFDRTTGKVYDGTSAGIGQVDRGAGFISLKNDDDVNKIYDLTISNVELGMANQFGKKITNYVCHYQLSQPCNCPPETGYANVSLQSYVDAGYTCTEAQHNEKILKDNCSSDDGSKYYCENNPKIEITNCVKEKIKSGYAKSEAKASCERQELECNPFYCKNTTNGTDVNISKCVYEKAKGKNLNDNAEEIRKINEECAKAEPACTNTCYDNVNFCIKYENKSKIACENEYKCCPEALTCEQKEGKSYTECFKKYCVNPYKYTCKFLGQTVDLTSCLTDEGKTYGQCFTEYCNTDTKCTTEPCYFCKTKSGTDHDISSCVAKEVAVNHKTIKTAYRYCTVNTPECNDYGKKICSENCKWTKTVKAGRTYYIKTCSDIEEPCQTLDLGYCKDGKCQKIVYRTIDLNNPFPGKSGEGVTSDFSNNGTGRYPNSNWNYAPLVKEKILNARGAQGDELYKLEPLYTIILTPENMRKIKSKSSGTQGYNYEHKYSDFTLNCLDKNDDMACVSSFLHSGEYVTIDANNSVCGNITNIDEFKKCYERIN